MTFIFEWHEVIPKTYSKLVPIFESLQSIWIEAFLPLIKSKFLQQQDPRLANLPEEIKDQKITEMISKALKLGWDKRIKQLHDDLENKQLPATYLAIARDSQKKAIGFVLMKGESIKDSLLKNSLDKNIKNIIEQINDLNDTSRDQIYVSMLAVSPNALMVKIIKLELKLKWIELILLKCFTTIKDCT